MQKVFKILDLIWARRRKTCLQGFQLGKVVHSGSVGRVFDSGSECL